MINAFELKALLAVAAMNPTIDSNQARQAIAWACGLGTKEARTMEGFMIFAVEGWALPANAFDLCVASSKRKGGTPDEARAFARAQITSCKTMADARAWDRPDADKLFEGLMRDQALARAADLIGAARKSGKIRRSKVGAA